MTPNNDRHRCDKCSATWTGNTTRICPRCGVGIDIGNLVTSISLDPNRRRDG